jgi:hypothetical protein
MQRLLLTAVATVLLCAIGAGQTITASLQGRTYDKSGAMVTKAKVTATNSDTGLSRSTISGDTGDYQIAALPVGNYRVAVEAQGFQSQTRTVKLTVGETVSLDFSLAPGQVAQ